MKRFGLVTGLFAAAFLCGLIFLAVSHATLGPAIALGTGPNGVQITSGGWLALVMSVLGTGGFTLAGFVTAVANRFGFPLAAGDSHILLGEVVELTASFAALPRCCWLTFY